MNKNYWTIDNVGSTRYVVNFHNGVDTHDDGSPFYDMRGFSNRRVRDKFIRHLREEGYVER